MPQQDYEYSVRVDAPADRVWSVVSDVTAWPGLTASIDEVRPLDADAMEVGNRFSVKQPKLSRAVWTVTEVREGEYFLWESSSGGITTRGSHAVSTVSKGEGDREGKGEGEGQGEDGVTLTLTIRQSGFLARFIGLLAGSTTRKYMSLEANGIKERSEQPGDSGG